MSYVGRGIENLSDKVYLDNITASATATYNLTLNSAAFVPSSASALTVSLNGVIQKGGGTSPSYSVSGSQIIFSSALSSSDSIDFIIAERDITLQTPSAGSVGASQVAAGIITGQTELSAEPADTDEFLVSDAGTLKRIDYSLIKGGGKVLQVIVGTQSAEDSTSSSSFVATTLNASITPSATSSKVAFFMHSTSQIAGGITCYDLYDGSNYASGGESRGLTAMEGNANAMRPVSFVGLLSPNTTSAITYTVHFKSSSGSSLFGRSDTLSSLILMEIGA